MPKTSKDEIQDLMKSAYNTVIEFIKFFADKDLKCLQLTVQLRIELDKPHINIEIFGKTLRKFCDRFEDIEMQLGDASKPKFLKAELDVLNVEIGFTRLSI